jgi:hypothetical protein
MAVPAPLRRHRRVGRRARALDFVLRVNSTL